MNLCAGILDPAFAHLVVVVFFRVLCLCAYGWSIQGKCANRVSFVSAKGSERRGGWVSENSQSCCLHHGDVTFRKCPVLSSRLPWIQDCGEELERRVVMYMHLYKITLASTWLYHHLVLICCFQESVLCCLSLQSDLQWRILCLRNLSFAEKSLIVEGKREKKKVDRLTMQVSSLQREPFTITPGKLDFSHMDCEC